RGPRRRGRRFRRGGCRPRTSPHFPRALRATARSMSPTAMSMANGFHVFLHDGAPSTQRGGMYSIFTGECFPAASPVHRPSVDGCVIAELLGMEAAAIEPRRRPFGAGLDFLEPRAGRAH